MSGTDWRMTPQMRACLEVVRAQEHAQPPNRLPGGLRTVRALKARGLVTFDEHRRVILDRRGETT
jgi:hypothetical protein